MAMKKKRGKRKGAAPPPLKRGRKKELKRFEMATWTHENLEIGMDPNEVAFVVRTSGGTPLNASDVKKLFRALQHEIRSLGHHLKRKGQPLDPEPKQPKAKKEEPETPQPSDDAPEAEAAPEVGDDSPPEDADPDDSNPETPAPA